MELVKSTLSFQYYQCRVKTEIYSMVVDGKAVVAIREEIERRDLSTYVLWNEKEHNWRWAENEWVYFNGYGAPVKCEEPIYEKQRRELNGIA